MTFGERAAINDGKCGLSACPERMVAGGVGPRNESGGGFRCHNLRCSLSFSSLLMEETHALPHFRKTKKMERFTESRTKKEKAAKGGLIPPKPHTPYPF